MLIKKYIVNKDIASNGNNGNNISIRCNNKETKKDYLFGWLVVII